MDKHEQDNLEEEDLNLALKILEDIAVELQRCNALNCSIDTQDTLDHPERLDDLQLSLLAYCREQGTGRFMPTATDSGVKHFTTMLSSEGRSGKTFKQILLDPKNLKAISTRQTTGNYKVPQLRVYTYRNGIEGVDLIDVSFMIQSTDGDRVPFRRHYFTLPYFK